MNVGEAETVAALSPVTIEDEDEDEVEETVESDAVS
jgi:hypothetical protein